MYEPQNARTEHGGSNSAYFHRDIGKNNTCETYHTVIINKLLLIMKIQKYRILHTISEVHGLPGDLQVKNP